jgi:hypothetical protein
MKYITFKHLSEIHNKLLEDMLKRDHENLSREEAWLVALFLHIKLHGS